MASRDENDTQDQHADNDTAEAALARERGPDKKDQDQVGPKDSDLDKEDATTKEAEEDGSGDDGTEEGETVSDNPPLPDEEIPPLPNEPVPGTGASAGSADDGWEPHWDHTAQAYFFHNRFTGLNQWENPRVPEAAQPAAPGTESDTKSNTNSVPRPHGGYNPAIHGDYDPTAPYALEAAAAEEAQREALDPTAAAQVSDPTTAYGATGTFNRFTGRWQAADVTTDNFTDDAKSKRQMSAFFDVDAAANSHQGKSLKAERSGMKLSKQELKAFKEKRRERKEEKRRAWLRD